MSKKITELPTGSAPSGVELIEAVQGGINVKLTAQEFANLGGDYRGDWAGTTTFPATGGTYTAGVPRAGNRWRLTDTLVIGGSVFGPGSIIEAAVNTPGQTLTNWIVYAVQV